MRRKCPVCGLYVGAKPHTGPMHDRIRANQKRGGIRGRISRRVRRRKG